MKLILIRHGLTVENEQGIHQGQGLPGILSKKGKEQVKKLGKRMSKEKFDVVYSSDLGRAVDTAEAILEFHEVPVFYDKRLRERDVKELAGTKDVLDIIPKGYETDEAMVKRARKILGDVYDDYKSGTVVFVTHGGMINAFLSIFLEKGYQEVVDKYGGYDNTSVSVFEIGDKYEVVSLNCTKHL